MTLVPWRGGDARREWCWDITRPSLEALGYELFTGAPRGEEWARAQAVNVASEAAGAWDIALVADCDTIPDPASIRRATRWVADTHGGARPHAERWMTTQAGALVLAQRGPAHLSYDPRARPRHIGPLFRGGGLLVIHRDAWETIGGYDEATYIGWGYEDSAVNIALLTQARFDRLPGDAWHLWHSGAENRPRPESVTAYKELLKTHAAAIDRWAQNQGLVRPHEIL